MHFLGKINWLILFGGMSIHLNIQENCSLFLVILSLLDRFDSSKFAIGDITRDHWDQLLIFSLEPVVLGIELYNIQRMYPRNYSNS